MLEVILYDLTNAPISLNEEIPTDSYMCEVKHFRNKDGNKVTQNGGYSALFVTDIGRVYTSKCKYTDRFCKKNGVLSCIQKFLGDVEIIDYKSDKSEDGQDQIKLWVNRGRGKDFWYLNQRKYLKSFS